MTQQNRQVRRIEGTVDVPAQVENKQIKFDVGVDGSTDATRFIYQDSAGTQHSFASLEEVKTLIDNTNLDSFVSYDEDTDTYKLQTTVDGQVQNLGQETFFPAYNDSDSGATSLDPKVFYVTGSKSGEEIWKTVHVADVSDLGDGTLFGLNTTDMSVGASGKITTYGEVNDINTSLWSLGDSLYVSTDGSMTNIKPSQDKYVVGTVTKVGETDGIIFVNTIAGARVSSNDGIYVIASNSAEFAELLEAEAVLNIFYTGDEDTFIYYHAQLQAIKIYTHTQII